MTLTQFLRFGACFFGTLLIPLATSAAPAVAPAMPFSFDSAFGRLPKNVVPLHYAIAITPNVSAKTIAGNESITLLVRKPIATIIFNSLNERLSNVRFDGAPVSAVMSNDDSQLTTVTLRHAPTIGHHVLAFDYSGKMETGPQGLFVQPFSKPNNGGPGILISTQFESTDARRMFPCWDEPAFRATYTLTATVPAQWTTLSNMPIAKRVVHGADATTTFERSPNMPSYLVEFSAGDLAAIHGQSGTTKLGVWAVRGQERDGATALANATQILADYNDYFGYAFPLPKLDSIAIPGGFQGAMENWGAITYNDQALLLTPSSTIGQQQEVYSIQAHEMAHQWNGDLVTMGWWDDLWLNESFASWRSAKETAERNPSWKWWEVQDRDKEDAMAADSLITSHPIAVHVTDELKAANAFDPSITYSKGQAVLRMLEAYLGPDTFRDGIRRYIRARAFSNATAADLWAGLSAASKQDVGAIASDWIVKPGFPVITVTSTCDASGQRMVALSQKRFLLKGSDASGESWNVPISLRAGTTDAPHTVLLTTNGQTVAAGSCVEPLSANAGGVGYYRVAYDAPTLAANEKSFATLPDADKIVLLDDQWALVQSGAAKLPSYFELAESMGSDLDSRAWNQITSSLRVIERDERGTPGYPAFVAYARNLLRPLARQLGWDATPTDDPGRRQLRQTVLADLGAWGDTATLSEARKRFAAFVLDRKSIPPDDQATILQIVAVNADQATFNQLHAIAKSAQNETEVDRYYEALTQVRDPKLAQQVIAIAMSDEIPPQAPQLRLRLVGGIGNYQPQLSWQAFTKNVDALMKPLGMYAPFALAQYIPEYYWDALPLPDLESWVRARIPAEMAPELSRGMESAHLSLDQKTALVPATDAYVAETGLHNRSSNR